MDGGEDREVSMIMGGAGEECVRNRGMRREKRWCSMSKEEGGTGVQTPGWSRSGGEQAVVRRKKGGIWVI